MVRPAGAGGVAARSRGAIEGDELVRANWEKQLLNRAPGMGSPVDATLPQILAGYPARAWMIAGSCTRGKVSWVPWENPVGYVLWCTRCRCRISRRGACVLNGLRRRGEPVHQMIDLIAVLVTLLLTGSELAIGVFVHPVLSKLQDAAHAEAAKPLARLLGRVMPFWYAAAFLLVVVSLLTRDNGSWSWWVCLSSAALLAVTVPFSLICLVPINNRVAAWDLNALPGDWKSDRRRWDQFHSARIVILVLASVAIVAAALLRSGAA